jgi:hypothetical protein
MSLGSQSSPLWNPGILAQSQYFEGPRHCESQLPSSPSRPKNPGPLLPLPGVPAASPLQPVVAAAEARATAADQKGLQAGWGWLAAERARAGPRAGQGPGLRPCSGRRRLKGTSPQSGLSPARPEGGAQVRPRPCRGSVCHGSPALPVRGWKTEVTVAVVTKQEDTTAGEEGGFLGAALPDTARGQSPG